MRTNTFQTISDDPLDKTNQDARTSSLAKSDRTDLVPTSPQNASLSGAFQKLCHWVHALNTWLTSYYCLCGRTDIALLVVESPVVLLRANKVLRLNQEDRVKQIEIQHGTLWLTETPAKGDVLLHKGDCFVLSNGWPYVAQAIDDAKIFLRRDK